MIQLHKGDTVAIVSLSSGLLGEESAAHQLDLGRKRLESLGLQVQLMPNTLKGINYLQSHPEKRAEDLLTALKDPDIKGIICAIGGDDTYRLTPYLMTPENQKVIRENPKFFMGYSDTTINHLLLYQLGLHPFYGLSYITCFAELGEKMLPYSQKAFQHIFTDQPFVYESSPVWYEERSNFSKTEVGIPRVKHPETRGYELIQGVPQFSGHLLGGCVESLYELISGSRYKDEKNINDQYQIMPNFDQWDGAILFLETSEEKSSPDHLRKMLQSFKRQGIFGQVNGIMVGKPQDEIYYEEYKSVYREIVPNNVPILYNLNFGHAYPKMLLQYGANAKVDAKKGRVEVERV